MKQLDSLKPNYLNLHLLAWLRIALKRYFKAKFGNITLPRFWWWLSLLFFFLILWISCYSCTLFFWQGLWVRIKTQDSSQLLRSGRSLWPPCHTRSEFPQPNMDVTKGVLTLVVQSDPVAGEAAQAGGKSTGRRVRRLTWSSVCRGWRDFGWVMHFLHWQRQCCPLFSGLLLR